MNNSTRRHRKEGYIIIEYDGTQCPAALALTNDLGEPVKYTHAHSHVSAFHSHLLFSYYIL